MASNKYSRRTIALFYLIGVAILITVLLYLEQIAVLYVLATLALVALLITVSIADLEDVDRNNLQGFTDKQ